jgi:hypothetical protein
MRLEPKTGLAPGGDGRLKEGLIASAVFQKK